MASLAYPGSMVSRGVSWSSSLSPHSGCLIYVFISAPASRRISIKIKRGRDLWISRRIFFTKEEPRFQYPLGTVSSPMQSLPFVCSDPNPTGLIFLMPSLWHLRALSQKTSRRDLWWDHTEEIHNPNCYDIHLFGCVQGMNWVPRALKLISCRMEYELLKEEQKQKPG